MKIGFDITVTKINEAGSGIYAKQLIDALRMDKENSYHLFSARANRNMQTAKTLGSRLNTIYRDIVWTHFLLPFKVGQAHIDVLHVPSGIAPLMSPCPTVVSILDTTVLLTPQNFTFWHGHYSRLLLPISAQRASRIVTISKQSKRDIVKMLHVSPDKVTVTYLAAATVFRPVAAKTIMEIKSRYNLDSFILTVGSLEPRKNIIRLLQAYALIPELHARYPLVHVGPRGWLNADIPKEVERLGLHDRVRFLGYVSAQELAALYNAASLFVYPSLYEGFGLPVIEAMSCGCPVVTSNLSSLPEVAGDAGLLVDPYNVKAIAQAIERVLMDRQLADSMQSKGLERAGMFSWERCARETLAVYKQAV